MKVQKILTVIVASAIAFSIFGLTFSAVQDDGILRATSAGLLLGMCAFVLTVLAAKMLADMEK